MAATNPDHEYGDNIASWVAILISLAGFIIGGLGVVEVGSEGLNWPLIIVGIVLVLISPVVGLVLGKMGMGEARARERRAAKARLAR